MLSDRIPLVCVVALFLCMAIAPTTTLAQKKFFVQDQSLLAGSTGQEILLEANSDIPFRGFSFGAEYDQNVLTVTLVTTEGAMIPDPDFFLGFMGVSDGGMMLGYGCVFNFQEPMRTIPPGNDIVLCKIIVDVAPDIDTDTKLILADFPSVRNVITTVETMTPTPVLPVARMTNAAPSADARMFTRRFPIRIVTSVFLGLSIERATARSLELLLSLRSRGSVRRCGHSRLTILPSATAMVMLAMTSPATALRRPPRARPAAVTRLSDVQASTAAAKATSPP